MGCLLYTSIRALGAGEDAGLGFESKLYKGADGVYFYTEANHRKYSTNDNDIGFLTNFVLETGVSDLTVGGEVSGKKQFFFTPIGTRHGGAVDYEMITDFNDETGVYNTVVEGFIPSNELLNVCLLYTSFYLKYPEEGIYNFNWGEWGTYSETATGIKVDFNSSQSAEIVFYYDKNIAYSKKMGYLGESTFYRDGYTGTQEIPSLDPAVAGCLLYTSRCV